MNTNEQSSSLLDKLFHRINKNKKTVAITSTNSQSDLVPDNSKIKQAPIDLSRSNSNGEQSYSLDLNSIELNQTIDFNHLPTTNNKNNLNLDLSTIREEEFNLSLSNNRSTLPDLNINDAYHKLNVTNYLTPTYCDYCSQLLYGLIKQGLKCQTCGQNFHKRCIADMPKLCNKQINNLIAKNGLGTNFKHLTNNFLINENAYSNVKQIEIEHTFIKKQLFINPNYVNSTPISTSICTHCQLKITNDKPFYQCKDCQILVHSKCVKYMKKNCIPNRMDDEHDDDDDDEQDECMPDIDASLNSSPVESKLNRMSIEEQKLDELSDDQMNTNQSDLIADLIEETNEANTDDLKTNQTIKKFKHVPKQMRKRTQIGLQRLSQRVKKTSGYFWSGHMFYYTNKNYEFVTHYWKLDSKSILIYDSYRLENKLKEIPLESIKKANLCGVSIKDDNFINEQKCLFVLITDSEVFYCGMGNADQNSTMNVLARNFYNIFKMVYLPYGNRYNSRMSLKISAPKYEEKSLNEEYIINPQDLLGSGQFGQVYGGLCKATNQPVAIKVIDKTRFKDFQAETSIFQNEITILYNVQHPGIVRLFALFDEVDQLFIVTEKMSTDMLEMILNKKPSRLSERVAKFIIYQILIALNKLHDRNIAHCDLKPENILLTENVEFPQVKICDFGYAKIIGENSFRRSMVGTPAYSPPELKQKRLYNNSIDMWSMGVIVYVSLSGTFPFEEDRDIYEQIMNSNFMFPADPWQNVSASAINLINHFLQVKIDRRMSVNKALQHNWFSEDYQLYLDLLNLEKRVGLNWLTTKAQEEKWNQSVHL